MQKIINFFLTILAVLFISCSDDEKKYSPQFASAFSRGVILSITDEAGNDLLADKDMANNVSVYGGLSKRNIGFDMKSLSLDAQKIKSADDKEIVPQKIQIGKPFNYISFPADLPNSPDMKYEEHDDEIVGYGSSSVVVSVNKKNLILQCHYKQTINYLGKEPHVGNNGIKIQNIEVDGKYYNAKYYPGYMVLCLTLSGNTLKVDTK